MTEHKEAIALRRRIGLLLAAMVVWAAGGATALAGGWASVEVLNREALEGPLAPGAHELRIQVLQHGHFPVHNDRVTVVATLGDQRVEQVAEPRFLDAGHRHDGAADGHQHQRGAGWPEGQEPGYVARLDLPEPGLWQVTVTSAWPPVEGQNPIQFGLDVRAAGAAEPPATAAAQLQTTGAAGHAAPGPDWRLAVAVTAGMAGLAGLGLLIRRQWGRRNGGNASLSS